MTRNRTDRQHNSQVNYIQSMANELKDEGKNLGSMEAIAVENLGDLLAEMRDQIEKMIKRVEKRDIALQEAELEASVTNPNS